MILSRIERIGVGDRLRKSANVQSIQGYDLKSRDWRTETRSPNLKHPPRCHLFLELSNFYAVLRTWWVIPLQM
jgi:hypothetical protein